MTPSQSEESANALFDVINQLTRTSGNLEKEWLAVEDLRAITMRATLLVKPYQDAIAAEAAEEFRLQLERDRA